TGLSAFTIQSAINVWYAAVLTLAAGQLAWRLAGRAAVGPAMVIALIGLNPFGAWLWLARALFRHHGGLPAAWALLAGLGGAMQSLTFGFSAVQSSLLDRFWTGTALTPAIAIGLTLAWSVAVLVAGGSRRGTTRVFALVLVMAAWHPAYAALVAAALVAGLVAALPGARVRECIAGALALALAMSLAAPYVRACSVPGALTPVSPGLYRPNLFAMIVGTGVWWMLALPALIGALRGAQGRMLLVTLLVTSAMALFVVLPERNSEKILYAVWVLLAPFSAAGAIGWEKRLRWPRWRTVALVLALALPTTFLYVAGVARESRSPGVLIRGETEANRGLPLVTSGEREAYTRLRETTPG
ncbi:MAG TPA: hypothetical protein VLV15_02305, partial [Dongiaceae bacterium]|nr:hypothetical protein [Dongiaceae bacterium]